MHSGITDSLVHIPNYRLFRGDCSTTVGYGGVCVYMRLDIFSNSTTVTSQIDAPGIDNLFLHINFSHCHFVLGCIYRPRSCSGESILYQHLSELSYSASNVLVVGDFNLPHVAWPFVTPSHDGKTFSSFCDMFSNSNFTQLVERPTRYRLNQAPSLLDLILVNDRDLLSNVEYLPPFGRSDHITLHSTIQFHSVAPNIKHKKYINVIDYDQLNSDLSEVHWGNVLSNLDIERKWDKFMKVVGECISSNSYRKEVFYSQSKPWMNRGIYNMIQRKKGLWRRYLRSRSEVDYKVHRSFSNSLIATINTVKRRHELHLASSNNPKKFFKYVRSFLNTKVTTPVIRNLDGSVCRDNLVACETFADSFQASYTIEPRGDLPMILVDRQNPPISEITFSPNAVKDVLMSLKIDSAPGLDGLTAIFLNKCASSLAVPLSMIFSSSLTNHSIPITWKMAVVTPVFKKGDKLSVENYRPISLTSIACKVCERIVSNQLLEFLLTNNILPSSQHGFLPGRSVLTCLLKCVNDWTLSVDSGKPVDIIYLDFSKAFDRVPYRRLIYKLEYLGVRGLLLRWIESFLRDRKFQVRIQSCLSSPRSVGSGVPQGSVLGPLLFVLYVSDLPPLLKTNCSQYADDLKLYADPLVCHNDLQGDLLTISRWCSEWLLPLNASKCTVLHVGKNNPRLQYTVEGTILSTDSSHNDLGVIISEDLSWSNHVNHIVSKAKKITYLMQRAFHRSLPEVCLKIYTTYVRPILEFAGPVWCPGLSRDVEALERVQRWATRIPFGRVRPSYNERLDRLRLQSFAERRLRGDLIVTYRATHNLLYGIDHLNMFFLNENQLRGHSYKLHKQHFRSTVRQQFLCNRVFDGWNGLPASVVSAESVNSFKNSYDGWRNPQ